MEPAGKIDGIIYGHNVVRCQATGSHGHLTWQAKAKAKYEPNFNHQIRPISIQGNVYFLHVAHQSHYTMYVTGESEHFISYSLH